ncbi:MAG: hypothetical protein AB7S70_03490 [Hyphomicrobium sp.]|uniref:hypothetical protein n=1 Tax=Hyphomicrobium sp. TaxID=82 RepID=UPI003D100901
MLAPLLAALIFFPVRAAGPQAFEVLASARTNNRTASLAFRIPAHQANVSAICLRSGSLAITLTGIEIAFADGTGQRATLQETIPPGARSSTIPVDHRRAISQVIVTKQPGLRPGETMIQLLGKVSK